MPPNAFGGDVCSPFQLRRAALPAQEQAAYDLIVDGLARFEERICLGFRLDKEAFGRVHRAVHDDNPLLFQCESSYTLYYCSGVTAFAPHYRMDRGEYQRMRSQIASCVEVNGLLGIAGEGQMGKVERLHHWLVGNCRYGASGLCDSHEITGVFLRGESVCEGIARAFKYLCDLNGIASWYVEGWARTEGPGKGDSGRHAWNIVTLLLRQGASRSFHIDVTYDCCLSKDVERFDYFCLSDAEMAVDHCVDEGCQPPCERAFGYLGYCGSFAEGVSGIGPIVERAVAKGEKAFMLQVPLVDESERDKMEESDACAVRDAYGKALAGGNRWRVHPAPCLSYRFNPSRMIFCFELA